MAAGLLALGILPEQRVAVAYMLADSGTRIVFAETTRR